MLRAFGYRRLLLLLLLFWLGLATPAHALNLGAYWLYHQTGGDGVATREEFLQRYSLGVGPSLTYRPTRAITATAAVGYSQSQASQGHGVSTVEVLTPTARLSLVNDIFLAQLSGSSTTRKSRTKQSTGQSWDTTLGSTWNIPYWPSVHFTYGERTDDVDDTLKTTYSSTGATWDLRLAKLSYQHSKSRDEDRAQPSFIESDSHFTRIESEGDLWEKRIAYNFAQQYQQSSLDASQGSTPAVSGDAWGKIDPLEPTAPGNVYLAPIDDTGNRTNLGGGATLTANFNDRLHISFRQTDNLGLPLNILRIYTDGPAAEALVWSLYIDPTHTNSWQQVVASEPLQGVFVDDEQGQRIEITLPGDLAEDEILLTALNLTGPLTITKVEAVSFLASDFSSKNTDLLTNVSLRIRFTRTLSASTNLTLERADSETDTGKFTKNHRILSGRLNWAPTPYLLPSLGFSENRDEQSGQTEQISRFYSMTIATIPLPTMRVVLSVTHNESFDGNLQTLGEERYTLSTKAQIYPDLSADWSFSRSNSELQNADGELTNASAFSSRLNLNAQLLRGLAANVTTSYLNFKSESAGSSGNQNSETAEMEFGLLYRPSNLLALHGSYSTYLLDAKSVDIYSISMNLGLFRTDNTRLTLIASHRQADSTSDSFTLNGSWDISRHLAMRTRASYTIGDKAFYNFLVTLTLRL